MKKFFVLLKKEIRELLTPQMLVPLVIVVVMFMIIGKVVGQQSQKSAGSQRVLMVDLDQSPGSRELQELLRQYKVETVPAESKEAPAALQEAKRNGIKTLAIIPAGYEQGLREYQPKKIIFYSVMENFSVLGGRSWQAPSQAFAQAGEALSQKLIGQAAPAANAAALKQPLTLDNWVVIGDRQANVSPAVVSGIISSQTTFIPIILFLVITFSAQLVALSLASEKENKTLETLLSAPISRKAIVGAKLVAAGAVALLSAAVYLFGMRYYFTGLASTGGGQAADAAARGAAASLGLAFSPIDYVLLGLSLFFGILVALSIAMLLGAFAEDAKSVQGVTAPLMVLVMVPYFFTLLLDISSLSPAVRYLIYAIPFTHPFMAAPNLLLDNIRSVLLGVLYMAVVFAAFVVIASKIFASDKILTLKLNFRRKNA